MQPENQENHGSFPVRLVEQIMFEVSLALLAVFATFWLNWNVPPAYQDASLAPAGVQQGGWPLPWSTQSYVSDSVHGVTGGGFNILTFVANILLVYIVFRCLIYLSYKAIQYCGHREGSQGNADRYTRYVRYVVSGLGVIIIMFYFVIPMLTYSPARFDVGVGPKIQRH